MANAKFRCDRSSRPGKRRRSGTHPNTLDERADAAGTVKEKNARASGLFNLFGPIGTVKETALGAWRRNGGEKQAGSRTTDAVDISIASADNFDRSGNPAGGHRRRSAVGYVWRISVHAEDIVPC